MQGFINFAIGAIFVIFRDYSLFSTRFPEFNFFYWFVFFLSPFSSHAKELNTPHCTKVTLAWHESVRWSDAILWGYHKLITVCHTHACNMSQLCHTYALLSNIKQIYLIVSYVTPMLMIYCIWFHIKWHITNQSYICQRNKKVRGIIQSYWRIR